MRLSRREFVSWAAASGITLGFFRLAPARAASFADSQAMPSADAPPPGRVDGRAKVTGAKLYASDFRAADMEGWPATTAHGLLLRVPDATHAFDGLSLDMLPDEAKPTVVVTAEDLAKAGTRVPPFYAGDLFCPVGQTPLYLGQPAALLLFETFAAFDRARALLRDAEPLAFGAETGPLTGPDYIDLRFTRVAGATPQEPDAYSPLQEGWISPGILDANGRPIWQPLPVPEGQPYARGATHGEEIRKGLAAPGPGTLVLDRTFATSATDPLFLEPECGLAWYEPEAKALHLVLGVQSPFEAAEAVAHLLGEADGAVRPERIETHFAHVGGGFGGRDHTPFPLYVALAAVFLPGRPVRLAHDRVQQFQGGIKRHAFEMRSQIALDRQSGRMLAFAGDHVLDGGGLANYSASVAAVGATAAIGIYDIPKVDVTTRAVHSRGVTAGSMRGYGTLQTMTALETLVDEAAGELKLDPIALRRANLLATGGRSMTGNAWTVSVRTPEILDRLEAHPIWRDRAQEKAARAGVLVGTGLACCTKDYGTGADCALGRVEIDPEGRITAQCDAVEMGNGIGTALSNRVARALGRAAEKVSVARIDGYEALGLVTSGDPYSISQEAQDAAARNPRWVPAISSATSASIGAHVGTHAAAQAARIVFRFGLWPAALTLWGIAPDDPRRFLWEQALWQDAHLILSGLPPLPQAEVAARAHAMGGVTGAQAHAFSRWSWAQAAFPLGGGDDWLAEIDALAVRHGSGDFRLLDRSFVAFPPTSLNRVGTSFTSSCGTLVRVEIEAASGAVRVARAYSVLECGEVLAPEVVKGQAQGGFAMGLGHALLEALPPFEDGPGNGRWNLGDYTIARASDVPLDRLEIEVLPPVAPREPPKGMAEVVMIPVVPALLNAIHDATGHRFRAVPVTPAMLKEALACPPSPSPSTGAPPAPSTCTTASP